jgi:hypothetical protein
LELFFCDHLASDCFLTLPDPAPHPDDVAPVAAALLFFHLPAPLPLTSLFVLLRLFFSSHPPDAIKVQQQSRKSFADCFQFSSKIRLLRLLKNPFLSSAAVVCPWASVECGEAVAVEPRALVQPRVDEEPRHALGDPVRVVGEFRLLDLNAVVVNNDGEDASIYILLQIIKF